MARYAALLGRRIEVHYRSGDSVLPATGTLAADSGKSIFLEEQISQQCELKSFRWEIPYDHIVRLAESSMPQPASQSPSQLSPLTVMDAQH